MSDDEVALMRYNAMPTCHKFRLNRRQVPVHKRTFFPASPFFPVPLFHPLSTQPAPFPTTQHNAAAILQPRPNTNLGHSGRKACLNRLVGGVLGLDCGTKLDLKWEAVQGREGSETDLLGSLFESGFGGV